MAVSDSTPAEGPTADAAVAVAQVVERWREAYDRRDVEGALDLLADDVVWVLAPGAFTGKEAARRALEWDVRLSPTVQGRLSGIGILVNGNVAVMERVAEASAEGIGYQYPIVTIFELGDDGKIRRMRSYYDKLAIMQQVASKYPGIKGWVLKKLTNFLVAQGEKGLERPKAANNG
jgi:ketosteroid isomerase-like protein